MELFMMHYDLVLFDLFTLTQRMIDCCLDAGNAIYNQMVQKRVVQMYIQEWNCTWLNPLPCLHNDVICSLSIISQLIKQLYGPVNSNRQTLVMTLGMRTLELFCNQFYLILENNCQTDQQVVQCIGVNDSVSGATADMCSTIIEKPAGQVLQRKISLSVKYFKLVFSKMVFV